MPTELSEEQAEDLAWVRPLLLAAREYVEAHFSPLGANSTERKAQYDRDNAAAEALRTVVLAIEPAS